MYQGTYICIYDIKIRQIRRVLIRFEGRSWQIFEKPFSTRFLPSRRSFVPSSLTYQPWQLSASSRFEKTTMPSPREEENKRRRIKERDRGGGSWSKWKLTFPGNIHNSEAAYSPLCPSLYLPYESLSTLDIQINRPLEQVFPLFPPL